jgi:GNAT superfamily N-acetyltransferase
VAVSEPARLAPEHIPDGVALSAEAGWNQTGDDWRIFITRGATFGIRAEGALVATAAALPYEGAFGFVAMVLTTPAWRHRGFARRLLALAMQELAASGHVALLDASAQGQPVYERDGFVPLDTIERWSGQAGGEPHEGTAEPDTVAALDAAAFGAARRFLFDDMLAREGSAAIAEPGGCVMARRGLRASHIGPLIAADEAQALALLRRMLARLAGPVILDAPVRWRALAGFLARNGFVHQRPFTRMARKRDAPFGDPARLFAVTGPEFG